LIDAAIDNAAIDYAIAATPLSALFSFLLSIFGWLMPPFRLFAIRHAASPPARFLSPAVSPPISFHFLSISSPMPVRFRYSLFLRFHHFRRLAQRADIITPNRQQHYFSFAADFCVSFRY
jgi:hypothetical protein